MTITITAFERSPDGGQGLARDTRVRWALEEVRQPYEVRLVSFAALKEPGDHDDETLIMGEASRKALAQVEGLVESLLERRLDPERSREVARTLTQGSWTHDHPLSPETLKRMGIPVRVGAGQPERDLLDLYPQPRGRASQFGQ